MTAPRFTILCATYQQADYLLDMLRSVEAQTEDDYELIVVDDGSTDATPDVLCKWWEAAPAEMRSRTRVERTVNGGQSAAYQHGFGLSSGQWICLLDSDDRFRADKLARLAAASAANPGVGMIMHPLRVVDQGGTPTGAVRPQGASLSTGDIREQMRRSARHSAPGASGLVVRREVMAQMFPTPTTRFRFAADAYLSFGASCLAPVLALDEPLADYRMQPGGQYFIRMTSPAGLVQQVDFQRTVARHFDVEDAVGRNSFFLRNQYAAMMLNPSSGRPWRTLQALLRATLTDPYFKPQQKVLLTGFWIVTAAAGRSLFPALWGWFQRRQTGWNRAAAEAA